MHTKNMWHTTVVLTLLIFGVGCTGVASEAQATSTIIPPTETAVPPGIVAWTTDPEIKITFNEGECELSGTPSIPLGDYHFVFEDRRPERSEDTIYIAFSRILEEKTYQDVLDLHNDRSVFSLNLNGAIVDIPNNAPWTAVTTETMETFPVTFSFLDAGEHTAAIWFFNSSKRVYCGSLMVMEPNTE